MRHEEKRESERQSVEFLESLATHHNEAGFACALGRASTLWRARPVLMALGVALLASAPFALVAQGADPEASSSESGSSQAAAPGRVIDVEAARRAKDREHVFQFYQLPLVPFRYVGREIEKGLVAVDKHHLIDRAQYYMTEREKGVVPLFGSLGIGTGLTLGAKYYRNDFLRPGGHFEIPVRVSSLLYQEYGAALRVPVESRQRVYFDAAATYRVRTRDNFFGLGNDSRPADRSSVMFQTQEFFFGPRVELRRGWRFVAQFGYRSTEVFDGRDKNFPGITEHFAAQTIPGLSGARETISRFELVHDTRDIPGRPRRGGYESLAASFHQSADLNAFDFWRYEVNAERYLPLGSRNRTLALRFQGTSNQARNASAVPFFDQAILGGYNTLRGFPEDRFHDLDGMLVTAEYRYNLNSFTDVVAFVDSGQVARRLSDFSWNRMHMSYGVGLRLLSSRGAPVKLMLARSEEGNRFYFLIGVTF